MKKILVAYATRTGSTADIATYIAEDLRAMGAMVDVRYVRTVREIKGYDSIIIGSAIRMSSWLPEAMEFVKKNREDLSQIPTAFFLVSGLLRENSPEMRQKVQAFLDPVCGLLKPISIGLFAGQLDYSRIGGYDRSIVEGVSSAEGDWRDWEAIRQWTRLLYGKLIRSHSGPSNKRKRVF